MACSGCEHLQHENTGHSILARMHPFCAGYATKLKRGADGRPVPYAGCSKSTEKSEMTIAAAASEAIRNKQEALTGWFQ